MATIEERAIAAFNAINEREYKCALAESQVSKQLYDQVRKEYSIAQNAFVQGVMYQRNIDIEKACEWLLENANCWMVMKQEMFVQEFRKAMEE